ncbi:MAG: SH3 domain-containing protein [Anaerolineae bacterium]|nr:SH3 domain-containing protein [Anaerolineae bacterium]
MTSKFRLRWPVDDHVITQYFGENPHIYAKYNQAGHEGLDFRAPVGANIYACADGEVFDIRPNDGNAYGLHVRIRHRVNGREYHTIYAHLSRALVSRYQRVMAGELIGLAGLTGHTFGPHLHFTLKLIGAKTPGYPNGVIDPLPYLQEVEVPAPSGLIVYTADQVRLRAGPTTGSEQLAWLGTGEAITVLGDADTARARVGQHGQWIQVQRADGTDGFVAAWYLQLQPPGPTPAGPLTVYATEALNVRKGASTGSSRIAIALPHEPLTVIGDREVALARLGDRGEWLRVRLPDPSLRLGSVQATGSGQRGCKGYIAAWYVQTEPGPAPETLLTVYPVEDMNVRERPTVKANLIERLAHNAPLTIHDDPERARVLVGRYDEWLYVETAEGQRGWVAAWYVSTTPA